MLRTLSLFAGIGGFDLGLERTGGFKTVAFCEINPFCRRVLAKHWPEAPCYDDVCTLTAERLAADGISVDVICGGFPCQDVSRAGKRAGVAGVRTGLFWELVRTIRLVRPKFAIMENVANLLYDGMGVVLGALADGGYDSEWDCIPAYTVGSPQERDRVWIVAYPDEWERESRHAPPVRRGQPRENKGPNNGSCPNPDRVRQLQPGWCFRHFGGRPVHRGTGSECWRQNWTDRLSALCRMADGVSRRLDESKPIGNSLVPQIPELIGRAILAAEASAA